MRGFVVVLVFVCQFVGRRLDPIDAGDISSSSLIGCGGKKLLPLRSWLSQEAGKGRTIPCFGDEYLPELR